MQAILIDPRDKTIAMTEYDAKPGEIVEVLGDSVRYFDVVNLYKNRDAAFVDDEGLYADDQFFWMHRNYPVPLAGRGILLGCDEEGETVEVKTAIEQVQHDVKFLGTLFEVKMMMTLASGNQKNRYDWQEDYRPWVFGPMGDKFKFIFA